MTPQARAHAISDCDLYYDMSYSVAYSTFANLPAGNCLHDSFPIAIIIGVYVHHSLCC